MSNEKLVNSYLHMGYNYLSQDDYDLAIDCFNRLIKLDPANPDYYYERGMAYRRKALFENSNSEPNIQGSETFVQSNRDLEEAIRLYEQGAQ